jgi:TatD DNase family protein
MLIDTHAHLDFPEFCHDIRGVLDRAGKRGVQEIVTIGIDLVSSHRAANLAEAHTEVYATAGIHPHGARELDGETLLSLEGLACKEKVVAVGEVGLDYYRDRQPRPIQRRCLEQQLELAAQVSLPVVFHIRDAFDDFFKIIKAHRPRLAGGILHCFSGDWDIARTCLDMGFYISIPGTVTFPKAEAQQEVAKRAPLDRILVETDAPYLAPLPYRGKVNEPAFVYYTAEKIATLRGCTIEEVGARTTANAHEVFGISPAQTREGAAR